MAPASSSYCRCWMVDVGLPLLDGCCWMDAAGYCTAGWMLLMDTAGWLLLVTTCSTLDPWRTRKVVVYT
eukprot:scaffold336_cov372-Pavlova_lutheri.AAC.2